MAIVKKENTELKKIYEKLSRLDAERKQILKEIKLLRNHS